MSAEAVEGLEGLVCVPSSHLLDTHTTWLLSLKSVVIFSMTRNTWIWISDTCFCACHDLGFGSKEPEAEIKRVERNLGKPTHGGRCL